MSDRILINLLIPEHINDRMKSVCDDLGLTRTAFILTSIEPRIRFHENRQYGDPVNNYLKLIENMDSLTDLEQERSRIEWAIECRKEVLKEKN